MMCFSKPTRQNDRTFATLNPYATKSANMNPNQTHTHTFKHKKWKLSMLRQRFYQKKKPQAKRSSREIILEADIHI